MAPEASGVGSIGAREGQRRLPSRNPGTSLVSKVRRPSMTRSLAVALATAALVLVAGPARASSIDRTRIQHVVHRHTADIRPCYERALARRADRAGTIVVTFRIGQDGKVSDASIGRSDIDDADMQSCVLGVVRAWRFPRHHGPGAVTVRY